LISKTILRLILILVLLSIPVQALAQTPAPGRTPSTTPAPPPARRATAASTPTALAAQERLADAAWLQAVGDCVNARRTLALLLESKPAVTIVTEANLRMAQCYMHDGAFTEAAVALQDLLKTAPSSHPNRPHAHFMLGEALSRAGAYKEAEAAYLAARPLLPVIEYLTWQRIGAVRKAQANLKGADEAYRAALAKSPDATNTTSIRRNLADLALSLGNPAEAVAQYDALRGTNTSGALAAEMQFLAGDAVAQRNLTAAVATAIAPVTTPSAAPSMTPGAALAGSTPTGGSTPVPIRAPAEAVRRWRAAVDADITTKWAHAAIVALLDAGETVDDYQRGVANYHNGVYALAIAAFDRLREADPTGRQGLAWFYSGLSHLGLGDTNRGIAELDEFIARSPDSPSAPEAQNAKARALQRVDRDAEAVIEYRKVAERWPTAPVAPKALYQGASLQAWLNADAGAADAYVAMGRKYPKTDEAWRAYQAAGLIHFKARNWTKAAEVWREMATAADLPAFARPVANFWLGRALDASGDSAGARIAWQAAREGAPDSFYGLRAAAWLAGRPDAWVREGEPRPSETPEPGANDATAIASWLRTWAGEGTLMLPDTIKTSGEWRRAETLLAVGRRAEGLAQLERVRQANGKNAWALSGLALAFRDLGSYRLSLLAAEGVVGLSGKAMHEAPPPLQRLAYPMPYEDLIRQEAKRQNLDPRLLAAIMRQESRFEAGVASTAGAQGLMQVMPGTAEGIARQMKWPNFESRQAYWPYVNVAFGAYYVRQWLSHFDGSIFAALAAYNGGPGNAGPWYNQAPDDDDLFAANININETRVYIQAVWSNYEAYRRLYAP
jgi:soluble lytic murein transglycosylase